jgi:hypothetical protein
VLDLDSIDAAEPVPPPPDRSPAPAPVPEARTTAPPVEPTPAPEVETVVATEAPPAVPRRTDTDPLYRIRLVATVAVVALLGWVFVVAIGEAGEVLGSITETMLAPFRG